jgi:hypothetical protein
MSVSIERARQFVSSVDLPDVGPRFETVEAIPEIPSGQTVITVGSQLTEFDRNVPPATRMPVANSMLLAQLAANKAASQADDVLAWYNKYNEVLQGIGWQVGDFDLQQQSVKNKKGSLHQEIVPVLTAMLGPAVATTSMVISVLKGLQNMDKDSPWITLFDRSSQHASGAKFQVTYIDADANGDPQISAACFAIQAKKAVTQVLFFKFSSGRAELKQANAKLSASKALLEATDKQIAERVQTFVSEFIKNVEI